MVVFDIRMCNCSTRTVLEFLSPFYSDSLTFEIVLFHPKDLLNYTTVKILCGKGETIYYNKLRDFNIHQRKHKLKLLHI